MDKGWQMEDQLKAVYAETKDRYEAIERTNVDNRRLVLENPGNKSLETELKFTEEASELAKTVMIFAKATLDYHSRVVVAQSALKEHFDKN
jgi:hypothetical protein